MSRQKELITHLFRLVHVARSVGMKCALTAVDSDPALNFWRLILGNQLDIAVIEWCKVFGSYGEPTHWKNIVPAKNHDQFRRDLLEGLGITPEALNDYWTEMKKYRDTLAAHHIELKKPDKRPVLDLALKSSCFYYRYLIKELRSQGVTNYPDDLDAYATKFEEQAREIAKEAMTATAKLKESVF